jgi:antitoxin ParD1/3/4
MARQTITLAEQNDAWLKEQVAKAEFTSKSEAVNYLIKQARDQDAYVEFVRMKLRKS